MIPLLPRLLSALAGLALAAQAAAPLLEKFDLFHAQQDGYALYRIPGIVVTAKGTVLAYCEARVTGKSKNTILKLLAETGAACAAYQDQAIRGLTIKQVQVDSATGLGPHSTGVIRLSNGIRSRPRDISDSGRVRLRRGRRRECH